VNGGQLNLREWNNIIDRGRKRKNAAIGDDRARLAFGEACKKNIFYLCWLRMGAEAGQWGGERRKGTEALELICSGWGGRNEGVVAQASFRLVVIRVAEARGQATVFKASNRQVNKGRRPGVVKTKIMPARPEDFCNRSESRNSTRVIGYRLRMSDREKGKE